MIENCPSCNGYYHIETLFLKERGDFHDFMTIGNCLDCGFRKMRPFTLPTKPITKDGIRDNTC